MMYYKSIENSRNKAIWREAERLKKAGWKETVREIYFKLMGRV